MKEIIGWVWIIATWSITFYLLYKMIKFAKRKIDNNYKNLRQIQTGGRK